VLSDPHDNTKTGTGSLASITSGSNNTANGDAALHANTSGGSNLADGVSALSANKSGSFNTGVGSDALDSNVSGSSNVALGAYSGSNVTSGSDNIALGAASGWNVETGSNNIDIGASGVIDESGVIRVGTPGVHAETFIAGIAFTHLTGAQVIVTTSGQLGVLASSERYKTAIKRMDVDSTKLQQLRPVTFHLKTEPQGVQQYGLIAEEVDKIYPDLVLRNESGQIEGVRYDELAPILLREVQQQQQTIEAESEKVSAQDQQLAAQAQVLRDLKQQFAEMVETNRQMQVALSSLQTKASQVASR
jgi:hypothetical protein